MSLQVCGLPSPVQRHVRNDLCVAWFVGLSAVQLSLNLRVQYKTAFVLMHRRREAMAAETVDMKLANVVDIDAYFGGMRRGIR